MVDGVGSVFFGEDFVTVTKKVEFCQFKFFAHKTVRFWKGFLY